MAKKSPKEVNPSRPKRTNVNIKKANNGYVVSSYGECDGHDSGEKLYIAKSKIEAKKYANKLLKI